MAAGVPIVASRAGGIPEIVSDGETGLLVEPGNPDVLARAIVRLLDDPALARRLADAAGRYVRTQGTKERMVDETLAVFLGALS